MCRGGHYVIDESKAFTGLFFRARIFKCPAVLDKKRKKNPMNDYLF